MRFRSRPLLVALAVAMLALGALSPVGAQTAAPEVGWWTQNQVAGVPIGRALLVPPGGSQVATGSDGPVSIAAVRFTASGGGARYEVGLEPGSDTDAATVIACPVVTPWEPTAGGPLSDAPAWDCALGQSVGAVDAGASTIAWWLPADFVRDGVIDVVLVPPDAAESFTLTMSAPGEESVTQAPAPPPTTTAPPSSSPPTSAASAPPASAAGPPAPATTRLAPSAPPTTAAASSPPTAPIGLPSPLPTTTVAPAELAVADAPAPSSTSGRVLGGIVLAALLAGAALASRKAAGPASDDGPDRRGVGRFVRPRSEPPVRI